MREPGPGPATPSGGAIRELVRRIVDATLDGDAAAAILAVPPDAPVAGPDPAAPAAVDASGTVAIAIGADHGGWQLKEHR